MSKSGEMFLELHSRQKYAEDRNGRPIINWQQNDRTYMHGYAFFEPELDTKEEQYDSTNECVQETTVRKVYVAKNRYEEDGD